MQATGRPDRNDEQTLATLRQSTCGRAHSEDLNIEAIRLKVFLDNHKVRVHAGRAAGPATLNYECSQIINDRITDVAKAKGRITDVAKQASDAAKTSRVEITDA